MSSWCRSTDYLLTQCLYFFTCKSVDWNDSRSCRFPSNMSKCYCWSELEGCQDSKKSDLVLEDWMFRGSGVLYIPILSISLLGCLPAWSHLLNDGYSKPVWLFTTRLRKEQSSAKITLPDFSFKLRIDQGRKLKHIKAENICSEKIRSLPHYSPAFCLYRLRRDWLLFLGLDTTKDAWIESIEKRFLPNSSCLSHGVSKIPSFS